MVLTNPTAQPDFYEKLPKVELHRHLEGSVRLKTLIDVARKHQVTLPVEEGLDSLVQMQPTDHFDFSTFLSKFDTLRRFYLSPEVISRVAFESVADAAADHIRHFELRFTPVALSRVQGYPLEEVIDWVCDSVNAASAQFGISTVLIASVNRHEPVEVAEKVARLACDKRGKGIAALDLAGNEAKFSAQPFLGVFREAKENGLRITVHAGEWGGAGNVREAIELIDADRIGHGVRVLEDPFVVGMARERGVMFEVCVTSNYQTGVVASIKDHPLLQMLTAGLRVSVNTDDPSISQIFLSNEYRLACEELGLSREGLYGCILDAASASFLPDMAQKELMAVLKDQFISL